jgi:ankyrin repeat protein
MKLLIFLTLTLMVKGCSSDLLGNDPRLFMGTPVWKVAKAISIGDTSDVRAFYTENPTLIDYRESKFGQSILNWAVYSSHYKGVVVLSDLGADPNLEDVYGVTAFVNASDKIGTSEYLKVLLENGGDVNYVVNDKDRSRIATPLIAAAWCRLESVKLLVEAGADVNYIWSMGGFYRNSPIYSSFRGGKIDIIRYLIVEAEVDCSIPLSYSIDGDSLFVLDKLRYLPFPLGSDEYKLKMEVVDYLQKQGLDYWKTPIPKSYYEKYDSAYLEKY